MRRDLFPIALSAALLGAVWAPAAVAVEPDLKAAMPLVTTAVDESSLVIARGERAPVLAAAKDRGPLEAASSLPHVMLALKRPAARQAAFDRLVAEQQDPKSPRYRAWLTPDQLRQYGPDEADVQKVTAWLTSRGMMINSVAPSGMSIDFSGVAGRIGEAFHTEIHHVEAAGERHIANMSDPAIPAALAPVIRGVTLANFFPKPNMRPAKPLFTIPDPSQKTTFYAVVPADFNKIYNVNPLLTGSSQFGNPITGKGSTIAVVEQTNIKTADWNKFRSYFALSGYSGKYSEEHPGGCQNPGFTGDEGEAAIDAEWASAPAPGANIIEASCAGTETSFGVMTALQNLVEISTKAQILSISYGGCESGNGLTFLAMWNNLLEEGASEGLSIFVSSGDSGSSCDGNSIATNGVGVNGLATSAYNVSVGGTDFLDTYRHQNSLYWTKANAAVGHGSAKSYVPEIPWNNSCANPYVAGAEGTTNLSEFCNATDQVTQNGVGGSGGRSVYYQKPDWQSLSLPGMPNDGVRDQPDVSLFAANGIFGHFYLICMSDTNEGGAPCDYTNLDDTFGQAFGGTSVAAPAFAGIMGLIVQDYGHRLGNPAPRLYQIAQAQFTNSLLATRCQANLGNKISSACVFNNVTSGNNAEPCAKGTPDCKATKAVGILAGRFDGVQVNAWPAKAGYNLATGLGSVNVTNLLYNY